MKLVHVDTSCGKLAVYDSEPGGKKAVLFFVHGLSINSGVWKYAITILQKEFRCIAIDLPGHGQSWKVRGDFTMSFYAKAVRECIEAMQLQEISLAGHSMGGQISIILALQLSSLVRKLVLVSSAGIETFTSAEAQQLVQGSEYLYRAPVDAAQLLLSYQPQFAMTPDRVRELAQEHLTQQAERFPEFSDTTLRSIKGMLQEPVNAFLPQLTQPALVLYGQYDRLIPNKWIHSTMTIEDVAEEAKKKIRQSTVTVLPDCGHYLQFEQPHIFAERVQLFCKA